MLEGPWGVLRTNAEYCQHFDDGAAELWAALFTEDGSFAPAGRPPVVGRPALIDFVRQSGAPGTMKHITANAIVDLEGAHARTRIDYMVVRIGRDGLPFVGAAGRYHDELVWADGRWLFKLRQILPIGRYFVGDPEPGHWS